MNGSRNRAVVAPTVVLLRLVTGAPVAQGTKRAITNIAGTAIVVA